MKKAIDEAMKKLDIQQQPMLREGP